MRRFRRARLLLPVALCAVAAPAAVPAAQAAPSPASTAIVAAAHAAARRYHVPADLLLAEAWVNTHWRVPGQASPDGGWGPMHLRGAGVARAARLTGLAPRSLRRSPRPNVMGGAAVLAASAGRHRPRSLAGWYGAVAGTGGGQAYADQVFTTLHAGVTRRIGRASVRLAAHPSLRPPLHARASQSADYPAATWVPASTANYTASNRPVTYPITRIVIHTTESSYSSAINWFRDSRAKASANYVIRSSDGAITQMVRNHDVAWHAGNWPYNTTSIGIEHEAYVGDCSWYTDAMYQSSARLVASLAATYAIPIDRQHIIGHADVPDPNHPGQYGGVDHHTDPGPCWNWDLYLSLVRADLGTAAPAAAPLAAPPAPGQPGFRQTVDNRTRGRFRAPGWHAGHSARGRWGRDYRYASPRAKSGTASFRLAIPTTGDYAIYARWPANRRYSSSAPIGVQTVSGLRWVHVDQRRHGGRWVRLGVFDLPAGDGWDVQLSRWTAAHGSVIADAVRAVAAR